MFKKIFKKSYILAFLLLIAGIFCLVPKADSIESPAYAEEQLSETPVATLKNSGSDLWNMMKYGYKTVDGITVVFDTANDTVSKEKITSIVFSKTKPANFQARTDLSVEQNGKILGYLSADETTLHIYCEDKITLSPDASEIFYDFDNVTNIEFNNLLDTSKVTDMSYMFDLYRLEELDLSCFDFSNVEKMIYTFSGGSLKSIIFPSDDAKMDTSNVTDMSYMFSGANFSTIDLSEFDTSSVTNMSHMFYRCENLTTLDLTNFDFSNVENMSSMFEGPNNINSIIFPTDENLMNTKNVKNMSNMFKYCTSLDKIDLSGFDFDNVELMLGMFSAKTSSGYYTLDHTLTEIKFPEEIESPNLWKVDNMFEWRAGLTNIDISKFDFSRVVSANGMFAECLNLENITGLGNFNKSLITSISNTFWNTKMYNEKEVGDTSINYFSKILASQTEYSENNDIDKIYLGQRTHTNGYTFQITDISRIGMTSGGYVYYSDLLAYPLDGIETFNYMFEQCADNNDFADCVNVLNTLSSSFTNLKTIDYLFANGKMTRLHTTINLPSSITSAKYMFYNCDEITTLADTTTGTNIIDASSTNLTDLFGMFSDCDKITSLYGLERVKLGSNVKSLEKMFADCSNLKTLVPDGKTIDLSNVTNFSSMFEGAGLTSLKGLKNIIFGNGLVLDRMFASVGSYSTELNLSGVTAFKWDQNTVSSMNNMFDGFLHSLRIDELDTNGDGVYDKDYLIPVDVIGSDGFISSIFLNDTSTIASLIRGVDLSLVPNWINTDYRAMNLVETDFSSAVFSGKNNFNFTCSDYMSLKKIVLPKRAAVVLGSGTCEMPKNFITDTGVLGESINVEDLCPTVGCSGGCGKVHEVRKGSAISINYSGGNNPTSNNSINYSTHFWNDAEFDLVLPPQPVKYGYKFLGWDITANGTKIATGQAATTASVESVYTINEGGSDTISSVSYTAQWEPIESRIYFSFNDGADEDFDWAANGYLYDGTNWYATCTYNETLPTLPVPTKDGYTFNGWKGKTAGNADIFYNNTTSTTWLTEGTYVSQANGDSYYTYTLQAEWGIVFDLRLVEKQNSFDFVEDGKNPSLNTNAEVSFNSSNTDGINTYQELWEAIESKQPTRDGYTFNGWTYFDGSSYIAVTASNIQQAVENAQDDGSNYSTSDRICFYASWTIKPYQVTFDVNGGDALANNVVNMNYYDAINITPTRPNYQFTGWKDSANRTYQVGGNFDSQGTYDNNISKYKETLTAQWQAIRVKVYIDTDGGSLAVEGNPATDEVIIDYDTAFNIPTATKKRNKFVKWVDGSGATFTNGSSFTAFVEWSDEEDMYVSHITAVWEEIEEYTVNLKFNDALNYTEDITIKVAKNEIKEFDVKTHCMGASGKYVSYNTFADGKTFENALYAIAGGELNQSNEWVFHFYLDGKCLAEENTLYTFQVLYVILDLKFDVGGVVDDNGELIEIQDVKKTYDTIKIEDIPSLEPQKNTGNFLGWYYKDRSGILKEFSSVQDFETMMHSRCYESQTKENDYWVAGKTLYALWEDLQIKVIIDPDGGDLMNPTTTEKIIKYRDPLYLEATKENKILDKWVDKNGNEFVSGFSFDVDFEWNESQQCYVSYLQAIWREKESFEIKIIPDDPMNYLQEQTFTICEDEIKEIVLELDLWATECLGLENYASLLAEVPSMGYNFTKGCVDVTIKFDGSKFRENVEINLRITYNIFWDIAFDNGSVEVVTPATPFTKKYTDISNTDFPSLEAKQPEIYKFSGWQVLNREGNLVDFVSLGDLLKFNCIYDSSRTDPSTGWGVLLKTLYAKWEAVPYRYYLDDEGNGFDNGDQYFEIDYGGEYLFSVSQETKSGYDCWGWQDNQGNSYQVLGVKTQVLTTGTFDPTLQKYVAVLTPVWTPFEYTIEVETENISLSQSGTAVASGEEITTTIEDVVSFDYTVAEGYQLSVERSDDFNGEIEIDHENNTVSISKAYLEDHLQKGTLKFKAVEKQLTLTINIDNLTVECNGETITTGKVYNLTVSSEYEFTYIGPAGYRFELVDDGSFSGDIEYNSVAENNGSVKLSNITDYETITLRAVARDNLITVSVFNAGVSNKDTISSIVAIANEGLASEETLTVTSTADGFTLYSKTNSKLTIKIVPKKGYEIAINNITARPPADDANFIVSDYYVNRTKIVNWNGIYQDSELIIVTTAQVNSILRTGDEYFDSLKFNNDEVLGIDGSTVYTGQSLVIEGNVKYGYENISLSISNSDTTLTISDEKCEWDNTNKIYKYSAIVSGFDSGFTVNFSGEARTYRFKVQLADSSIGTISPTLANQTLKFGQTLKLDVTYNNDLYIFDKWEDKDSASVATTTTADVVLNSSIKNFLEKTEGGVINVYARYKLNKIELNFAVANGIIKVEQIGITAQTLEAGVVKVFLDKPVVITLTAKDGYHIDWEDGIIEILGTDGSHIDLTTIGFVQNQNSSKIQFNPNQMMKNVNITCKANLNEIFVQTTSKVDIRQITPSSIGGVMLITDENGNELDDSLYLEVENFEKGSNYKATAYTGTNFYFVLKPVEGFVGSVRPAQNNEFTLSSQTKTNDDGQTQEVYCVRGFIDSIQLNAIFEATTKNVEIEFITVSEDGGFITGTIQRNAGMIVAQTGEMVVATNNNTGKVTVKVVEGYDFSIKAYAGLGYNLINDFNYVEFYYIAGGFPQYGQSLGQEEDYLATGYNDSFELEVTNVEQDATIYIVVVPKFYFVKLVNKFGQNTEVLGVTTAVYGYELDISGFDENVLKPASPSDIYEFGGYWTHEYCQGNQYTTKEGTAGIPWLEPGYVHSVNGYEPQHNYDPITNTFTIYAGWSFKKAKIHFNFYPDGIIENYGSNLRTIILNEDTDNEQEAGMPLVTLWETFDDLWYCEISHGSVLKISPPDIWRYELQYIEVVYNGAVIKNYTPQEEIVFDAFPYGDYEINFVHLPQMLIEVANLGTPLKDGGASWSEQDGKIGTDISFVKDKPIALKAKANIGYKFLYWQDKNNAQIKFYATEVNPEGESVLTLNSPGEYYYHLVAVFEGETITVNMENATLLQYHDIEKILTNGKAILDPKAKTFESRIGDEIEIIIKKSVGYTFDPKLDGFTSTLERDGFYHLKYLLSVDNVDFDSKSLTVGFEVGKEKLNVKVWKSLIGTGASSLPDEVARSCVMVVSDISQEYTVDQTVIIPTFFGDKFEVDIRPAENYRFEQLILHSNGQMVDLTNRVAKNKFVLSVDIMERYFAKELEIEVVCKRMIWLDYEYRSHSLDGLGTKETPFLIKNAEDFALVAYYCNNDISAEGISYAKAYYKVTNNIDFAGKYWVPIGTESDPFKAVIDLGSFEFTNITYYQNYDKPKTSYSGLFWIISDYAIIRQYEQEKMIMWACIGGGIGLIIISVCIFYYARAKKEEKRVLYS